MMMQCCSHLPDQNGRQRKIAPVIFYYNIIFLLLALSIYAAFKNSVKAPFNITDGLLAYYPTAAYIGEYVRGIINNHKLIIPFFEYRLGLGDDIFILLWSGLLNPFLLLVFTFVSIENTESFYWLFCFLQLYAGGICFILYSAKKPVGIVPILCGVTVYISSGFALTQFLMNPLFTLTLFLTPLVFWAVEDVVDNGRTYPLSLTIMFSIYVNFYFTYMISIFALLYGALYAWQANHGEGAVKVVKVIITGAAGYILGIMLAAPVLLPLIYKYTCLSRKLSIAPRNGSFFIYSPEVLLHRIASLFAPGINTMTNVIPLCFLAAAVLFCRKKKEYVIIKFFLLLIGSGLFFPFFGYILAAGSYVNDRWAFILSFTFSLILTYTFDDLANISKSSKKTYAVFISVILAYLLVIVMMRFAGNSVYLKTNFIYSLMMLLTAVTALTYCGGLSVNAKRLMLFCFCLICVLVQIYYCFYSADAAKFLSKFTPEGRSYDIVTQTAANTLDKIERPGAGLFFRSDTSAAPYHTRGSSVLFKQFGISGYRSMLNPVFTSSLFELENNGAWHMWQFHGFDGRVFQLSLASVKYFAMENTYSKAYVPYGFKEISCDDARYKVFINDYMLPLGYTYDNCISRNIYDKFDSIEKQEAQLQAVVLEKEGTSQKKKEALIFLRRKIPLTLDYSEGITYKNGVVKVTKKNAAITVNFVPEKNSEMYLRLCGLDISELSTHNVIILGIDYKGMNKTTLLISNRASIYTGLKNHIVNLGYHNDSTGNLQKCIIRWPKEGTFKLDDIQVYAQPMNNYPAQINKLREDVLENIYVGNDKVSGTISLKKNKILCLSIPYSKGWHAKVDGKNAELLKANSLFMALPLEAGKHKIELEYHVPGFRLGLCFFALGAAILSFMIIHDRKRNR